jgi:hypothetical protein
MDGRWNIVAATRPDRMNGARARKRSEVIAVTRPSRPTSSMAWRIVDA